MKSIHFFVLFLVAAVAGAAGWLAARHGSHSAEPAAASVSGVIYTCSMHPQVRQNKPGSCPFCGMALAPLNSAGHADLPAGSVMLSSNRVNAIHVQTTPVRRQSLHRSLRLAGVIDDNDTRHRILSAVVDGRIDKLLVNFVGAEVEAGQPLATLYSPTLLAAEREFVVLSQRPSAAASSRDEHQKLLAGARQRLRRLGLSDAQIDSLPAKDEASIHTDVAAPNGGTVVNRFVYEGSYVKEGDKLFEIADFSTMWFRFDAYERDLAWLQPGQIVEVTTPSVPGKVFKAPIRFIDPNLNEPTRSAKVRVELANPLLNINGSLRRELLHKIYAEGHVDIASPDVLALPRSAVLAPGRPYVFVDRGQGVYEQRFVQLGRAGDELWEVLDGVKDGESVVTTGNLLIDSQAQLDAGGVPEQREPQISGGAGEFPPLSAAQQAAATNFLAVAAAVTAALADDNLGAFNERAGAVPEPIQRLVAGLTNGAWVGLVQAVDKASRWPAAGDLKGARQAFHPFSLASADLALALRRHGGITEVRLFQCPMVKQSFPGAPRTGRWIQLQPQIRNPYFGAEMLDCGSELKP